jgi:hypothetical protein
VNDWDSDEKKHHRIERRYWFSAFVLSVLIAVGALGSAIFAYKAWSEAHVQAEQARRQADTAEKAFATTTRAWLKLTAIDAGADRSDRTIAWFNFRPTYKNLGHTPAKNISFVPYVFVIGVPGRHSGCQSARKSNPGSASKKDPGWWG